MGSLGRPGRAELWIYESVEANCSSMVGCACSGDAFTSVDDINPAVPHDKEYTTIPTA